MQLGSKLKGFRTEKGLSSQQVADALGVSESTYRRYEADKSYPDINAIDKMAQVFNKPVFDFFPERIQQNNHQQSGGVSIAQAYNSTVNQLSEKLVEMYEERISKLKEEVATLKERLGER
ncbi:MAG: helix-turn-helix domain-containing protein [Vicingaceae bacterium]|nr:helix-turn-helix domain-containing protein [Vicingaceae bacterium]